MPKKQVPTIVINRISDDRRTATDAFLHLIKITAQNHGTTIENQTDVDYNNNNPVLIATQEG